MKNNKIISSYELTQFRSLLTNDLIYNNLKEVKRDLKKLYELGYIKTERFGENIKVSPSDLGIIKLT